MIKKISNSIFYHLFIKNNSITVKKILSGKGHIFMLHRILPEHERNKYEINRSLAITPSALQTFIDEFKLLGFEFISMDHILNHINKKKSKKFIAFTIDDGYKDNLIHGLPIFEKNRIPFTLYITNSFPNKKANHWWYHLEDFINDNDFSFLKDPLFSEINTTNLIERDKQILFTEIRDVLLRLSPDQFKNLWSTFLKDKISIQNSINNSECLEWNEIYNLSNHNLCTIGAHTSDHVALRYQSDETCYKQMNDSKIEIEDKIHKKVDHFSYPYGSLKEVSKRDSIMAKKIGYKTAVLNHPGSIFRKHIKNPFLLPRIGLSDNIDSKRLTRLFNGNLHFDFNGIDKLIKLRS